MPHMSGVVGSEFCTVASCLLRSPPTVQKHVVKWIDVFNLLLEHRHVSILGVPC